MTSRRDIEAVKQLLLANLPTNGLDGHERAVVATALCEVAAAAAYYAGMPRTDAIAAAGKGYDLLVVTYGAAPPDVGKA